ncbi:cation-translocating P-type ATPase [Carnobacterium gallinarum]|uniref:cation-translocating P-type ATPase n=1 Tax=Carnobacterium gallinarum TaxID=2749 RepID=UPI00054D7AB7|nr:cation-translocating P-type ATPase [Carnobacterium gallinarum]
MENQTKTSYKEGLSAAQVATQKEKGLVNAAPEKVTKTNGQIIKENVWTMFNLLNLIIGVALAAVGAYSNLLFMLIILLNICIGIFQEITAKNLVEKLSLISAVKAHVIRDGQELEVAIEDLVQDDIILLDMGDQIPADAIVVHGSIEANESLLTGESDSIMKREDAHLLSGSFVVSGRCYARIEKVGAESFSAKIAHEAKKHKKVNSELIRSMNKVTKFTSYIIIPIGVVLFLEALFVRSDDMQTSVVATAAALLGMLPKGLVLLISLALATGVIKLSKKNILVQEMFVLETLAHVDVLCLDKTGTITEGKMSVSNVTTLRDDIVDLPTDELIGAYIGASEDRNATMTALRAHFTANQKQEVLSAVAFSSERKWGAINFANIGSIVFGAPEMLLQGTELPELVINAQKMGTRILLLAHTSETVTDEGLPQVTPVAAIELDDPIRKDAKQTLDYFKAEGVAVKVISGDNPVTVSNIARKAGLEDYATYVDLSTITDEEEVRKLALTHSIFGRVSPEQKQLLVKALQANGNTVAMTGDGVNDVLALREADCSIAMAEGNDAAKQVSQLVLLNSDFSALPDVLAEGRRVVNNVTKVASIFFIKTIYSVILAAICILTTIAFPFIPTQITMIDLAIEGYPSFFLSFEPNKKKVKGKFLNTVIHSALPNSLLIIMNIIAIYFISDIQGLGQLETTTLMFYMVGFTSILGVLRACLPFNPLRIFLFSTVAVGFYTAIYLFKGFLHLGTITNNTLPIFLILMIITAILRFGYSKLINRKEMQLENA